MTKTKISELILLGSFFVVSLASQAFGAVITVDVTIKPGGEPNSINPNSKGLIPVAILGSPSFDVNWIEATSLTFGPRFGTSTASPAHHQGGHLEDVNGDGFIDLLLHFKTQETQIHSGATEACVMGNTFDGTLIMGCDAIRTVPESD